MKVKDVAYLLSYEDYTLRRCPRCLVVYSCWEDEKNCYECHGLLVDGVEVEDEIGSMASSFRDSFTCVECREDIFCRSEHPSCCGVKWCSDECADATLHECSGI